jgi:hypothetical protein
MNYIKRYQPLLKLGDYILVDGNRRKVSYIADTGKFEWNFGWANINQLETNPNTKSKILFTLKTN